MTNFSELSDEEVVQVVRRQDKEAYAEIIRRYQEKLLRYAGYLTKEPHQAADAVQQGLIKAYVNLNSFNLKQKFSSWIYRIVHNEVINLVNKTKNQRPLDDRFEFDSGINLEDDLIKKELISHTRDCLKQMSLIYQEPLSLYYLEDKSYEEISDILRLPINTVGIRISRAKKLMKKICQK